MNPLWVVLRKELLDSVRDRRSLVSLLIFPLLGPAIVALTLHQAIEQEGGDERFEVAVVGAEQAPALMHHLGRYGVDVTAAPPYPQRAVAAGTTALVLVVKPGFADSYAASRPAELVLISDASRTVSRNQASRLERLLRAYDQQLGTLRLMAHGVNPNVSRPLALQAVDVSTARSRGALLLDMVPMFVFLATFIGGMYAATDSTAGERERGSLEPLLTTPASRLSLVRGKWLAAALLSGLTASITLVCSLFALSRVPAEKLGLSLSLAPQEIAVVWGVTLPLSLLVAALQMVVATFARSFREAQTYLSLVLLLPMLPGMYLAMQPFEPPRWMTLIPLFGQQMLLRDAMRGEQPSAFGVAVTALLSILLALLLTRINARLLGREKIIFGR